MDDIFDNYQYALKRHPTSMDDHKFMPTMAKVTKVMPRFTVDVLTRTNEILKNVRVFGPAIKSNSAHGRAFGIKKNQMVLVEYIGGSIRYPVVSQVFPFFATDKDIGNLQGFWDKVRSKIDFETDIVDFHESGYFVRQTKDKIEYYDSSLLLIGEIDFQLKKMKWEADIEFKGDVKISGDITVTGDVDVTGEIKASIDVKAGTTSLKTHTHASNLPPAATGPAQ